jgi:hypothetical protein
MGTRGRGSLATPRGSLFGGGGSGTGGSGVNSYIDLKLTYPSPFILSVEKVPLPPHALLVLIVVRVLPLSVRFTNALLSLSLLGVNSPPVVVAGDTVVSIIALFQQKV